jgi:hypothetical protein
VRKLRSLRKSPPWYCRWGRNGPRSVIYCNIQLHILTLLLWQFLDFCVS